MTQDLQDRREFVRVPFKTRVQLDFGSSRISVDSDIDISMRGLCIPFHGTAPDAGTGCTVSIQLRGGGPDLVIEAAGTVVRSEPESLSVEFSKIDFDGYEHLRRLIVANSKDPEKAEREFKAHWGIKKPHLRS